MKEYFKRTEYLLGAASMEKLKNSRIAVFGIGGVGGYVCEALVRSGIGQIDIFDNDIISETNINRQIIATVDTIGKSKTEVMKKRLLSINPSSVVNEHNVFYSEKNSADYDFSVFDYVIDAIDTVSSKIELILKCNEKNTKIISCMGTGNKLDPTRLEISDISKTSVCPLARVMRYELKKRNIKKLKVLYSKEVPIKPNVCCDDDIPSGKRSVPGSTAFVPAVAGLIIASEVVKDIISY